MNLRFYALWCTKVNGAHSAQYHLELSTVLFFFLQPHPLSAYVFLWTEKPPDWWAVLADTLPHKGSKGVLLRFKAITWQFVKVNIIDMQYM